MKRIILKSMMAAMVVTLSLNAKADEYEYGVQINSISYNLNKSSKTATVTYNYDNNYSGAINIPKSIVYNSINYLVTSIGDMAFRNCSSLISVNIPNSVVKIGFCAFEGCNGLTSMTIPNDVTSIGNNAFYGCCSLTSVTIPNNVVNIGDFAFANCWGLTSITIPKSVTSIGNKAFNACSGLTSIVVEYGNPVYDSRENCNAIIETSSSTLIRGCDNTIIPDGIRSICSAAFSACRNLTSLIIPTSVTSIGEETFINCSALISVTIPYGITCIPQNVFFGCSGLKSVIIPNSVKSISNDAFHNAGLTSIKIPDGITTIGSFAFCNCLNLASVIIPNDVTSIGQRAFSECRSLSSVISEIKEPFAFDSYAFFSIASNCTLTVPYGTKDAYIAAGWTEDVFKGGIIEAPNNLMPDNYLTMNNAEACKGESVVLPVNLNNTESITALQFEMALPAGITISKCQLTDRKGDDHTASYRKLVNGNYQVTVISLSKAVFSGTEGAVVNLTLDVDKDVAVGDYPINITNIELTTAATLAVNPADVTATLTVTNVKIGDVDGNGKVSITDAVAIVSHILGEDIDGFVAAAADVDGSGKITITDAVAVVDMILSGTASAKLRGDVEEKMLDPQ